MCYTRKTIIGHLLYTNANICERLDFCLLFLGRVGFESERNWRYSCLGSILCGGRHLSIWREMPLAYEWTHFSRVVHCQVSRSSKCHWRRSTTLRERIQTCLNRTLRCINSTLILQCAKRNHYKRYKLPMSKKLLYI